MCNTWRKVVQLYLKYNNPIIYSNFSPIWKICCILFFYELSCSISKFPPEQISTKIKLLISEFDIRFALIGGSINIFMFLLVPKGVSHI